MSTRKSESMLAHLGGFSRIPQHANVLLPAAILLVLLSVWEVAVPLFDIPTYVLPQPSAILLALVNSHSIIFAELQTTLLAFSYAFVLTVVTGYLLALVMYQWTVAEMVLYPYVITARAIPIVALIPIFIIWFGFGFKPIIVISYLISFFAMVVNSLVGFKSTDNEVIEMLKSFSANRREMFRNVYVYSSLPSVFAGIKICVILTFTGVIVGEFLIGSGGIGHLILEYNTTLATAEMFAGVLIISVTQLLLFGTVVAIERTVVTWE